MCLILYHSTPKNCEHLIAPNIHVMYDVETTEIEL